MTTTAPAELDAPVTFPSPDIDEHPGWDKSGWAMFGVGLGLLAVGGAGLATGVATHSVWLGIVGGIGIAIAVLVLAGLTMVQPNEARVLQLLGSSYSGTLRTPGLRWTNPLTSRRAISTRLRNMETGLSKVNDADGNPIEISAVVVWKVADTALATFGVDDYEEFVAVQTESAVRHIAGSYPYDAQDRMSLRENADEITAAMSEQVQARVQAAGVDVIETRINRLAYAPEIAQAMLRRQQAGAVIAARQQIVEGAVGMVDMALQRLDERQVVELDEERKAAMVSNLLVVLCGDRDTQPVLNTGSLYQ
ncbi:SPFH domain-containing protein [Williamsia sp. CHRR-6]|uniref:SPFH domain-containing protein n=1 Tax=Williamsia sp. CHRR-6 TaxID=2835871 RepID=UPI002024A78B|nr:SPFH domain-containing protein [Williamsia sp. CHRR-6]